MGRGKRELITQSEYARRRGVSRQAVSLAVRDGRIPTTEGGKIDPRVADRQWRANTDEAKPRNSVSGHPRAGAGRPEAEPENGHAKGPSYAQLRAVREGYEARLKRLEYEERMGRLVSREAVKAQWFKLARRANELLLALPDRLAPVLAPEMPQAEVHRILNAEIRGACEELSRETEN